MSSSLASRGTSSLDGCRGSWRHGRQLCVRPCATAFPDVKASDDTAEARRRLARQFRKHKLEPQQASSSSSRSSGAAGPGRSSSSDRPYSSQLVRPRTRSLPPQQLLGLQDQPPWHEQHQQPGAEGAVFGHLHPADAAAAAAAARELLEWQFQLVPQDSAEPAAAAEGASTDPAAAADVSTSSPGDSSLLQLPNSLLPGLSTAAAGTDAGKQLTKAIMRAGHWRQVQSLVQEHAPEMVNTRHLCAALTRMVYLQPTFHSSSSSSSSSGRSAGSTAAAAAAPASQEQQHSSSGAGLFLQQLYASLHGCLAALGYRQSCNVLWAFGKLQHTALPSTANLQDFYQHARQACASEHKQLEQQAQAEDCLAQAREQHLQWRAAAFSHAGQIASSLVLLQQVLPAQQQQDTVAWLMSTTRDLLQDHIQQHQPVPEQRAASKLQQQQQSPPQQGLGKPCQRPLPARDVANLAASLATLGAQPSPAWLSAFAAALGCKGLVYLRSYRDLSQLLWATARFSQSAPEGSAAANSGQAAAAALLSTAQSLPLSSCDGQALASTLWALATLGQRPPLPWLNRVLQHAEAAAARGFLSAQGVSMTLWALAALAVVPQASCLSVLLSAAQQHLRHLTPQGFSNVLWSLAVLERPPSKAWLAGFWPACRTLLPQMTSQGLVNCMWSAARLGLQPPQEWVGDVAGLLLQRGVGSLTSQGLSNVVWSLSKISVTCRTAHELLQSCLQQAVLVLQQQQQQAAGSSSSNSSGVGFNIYELSGLLHAVCHLRMREAAQHAPLQPQQFDAAACGSSSSSSSSAASSLDGAAAAAEGSDLLGQLTLLLQEVSTPLLPTAGPTELSIMLWSQVTMPVSTPMPVSGSSPSPSSSSSGAGIRPPALPGAWPASPSSAADGGRGKPGMLAIPRKWMAGWFAATRSSFSGASSKDLSQWVWCLAKARWYGRHRPHEDWLASWQVASYRQLGRASSQDLSNMLWSLASLGSTPDPAWLAQCMQEVQRRLLQKQMEPQHYGNIGWALAKMGHRPERFWADRYLEDVFSLLPRFKPQELTNVLWAMAVLNMKVPEELLADVKGHMTAYLPEYKVNEVAVSMWAMARLKGQPGLRLMAAALQHCFSQARQLTPTGLSMLMWAVGNMATPPPNAWVAKLLVATQVRMSGFSAQELGMLAVSLARLEYRPSDTWLHTFAAAAAARIQSFGAQALSNTLWALATLHYTPSEDWMNAFDAQLARHVHSCTPAHVAMTLWALSRLQWLPAQPLLQQLQERAEIHNASYIMSSQRMLARAVRVLQKVESEDEEEQQQEQQQQQQ